VYLDELCLLDGQKWQEGFIQGLSVSLVVVTILSWSPDDGGSLGKLSLMSEDNDYVDNVLVSLSCTKLDAINIHTLPVTDEKHTDAQTNTNTRTHKLVHSTEVGAIVRSSWHNAHSLREREKERRREGDREIQTSNVLLPTVHHD
jgi:hypothetical protein